MPDSSRAHYQIASDSRLARLAQRGDLDAYEHLVRRHQHRLVCFLNFYNVDRQLVEDAAQEAFLQCFLKIRQYDPRRSFRTWLYTIARRYLPRLQATRPRTIPISEFVPDNTAGPDSRMLGAEHRQSLWQTVRNATSGDEFELVWLTYADRLPLAEVADITRMSPAACKMKLSRLRQRLKSRLRPFLDRPATDPDPRTEPDAVSENPGTGTAPPADHKKAA